MRLAVRFSMLFLLAAGAHAADPVYIDQLMETPVPALQQQFPGLRKEGCYRLGEAGPFLMISIGKDKKPWRVALAADQPCRRADPAPAMEIRQRGGVLLGDTTVVVVEKLGRPDASAEPEVALRRIGDQEYFYICRVSEGCARHTSVFIRNGVVTGIAEWYSE